MADRVRRGRILQVTVDISSPVPLYRQIYESIRRDILHAVLAPGAQLPSTRHLATDIGVARSTVVQAYDQLRAEGYVAGTLGAGTRVSETLPDQFVRPSTSLQSPNSSTAPRPRNFGARERHPRGTSPNRAGDGPLRARVPRRGAGTRHLSD